MAASPLCKAPPQPWTWSVESACGEKLLAPSTCSLPRLAEIEWTHLPGRVLKPMKIEQFSPFLVQLTLDHPNCLAVGTVIANLQRHNDCTNLTNIAVYKVVRQQQLHPCNQGKFADERTTHRHAMKKQSRVARSWRALAGTGKRPFARWQPCLLAPSEFSFSSHSQRAQGYPATT